MLEQGKRRAAREQTQAIWKHVLAPISETGRLVCV